MEERKEKGGEKKNPKSKQTGGEERERKTPPNKLSQGRSPFKKKKFNNNKGEGRRGGGKTKSNNISLVLFGSTYSIDFFFKDDVKSN